MKKLIFIGFAIFSLASISAFTLLSDWKVASGYSISFDSDDASGDFEKFSGKISFDPKNLKSSNFDVVIDVASINTGNWLQDRHAKNDEWFDAEKFPTITFKSSKVLKTASGYFTEGTLTIREISKIIKIPFTFTPNAGNGIFEGGFTVNRMDFKIGKEGKVKDQIKIKLKVPVTN
ncbi:MAG: YceI family protein [Saprospiraceae bacterium]|nr:YceI family protein [Candidatus Brachybacter algidus]MBK8747685.1 YceI family protein [Candidatus Brachybacter algidus]